MKPGFILGYYTVVEFLRVNLEANQKCMEVSALSSCALTSVLLDPILQKQFADPQEKTV